MARETRTMNQKAQSFEGTTLALQHYYDIVGVSRRLPLITVYRADEQPFGHQMAMLDEKAEAIAAKLKAMGISVKYDNADNKRPGFKFAD